MTVNELIEQLKNYPSEMTVVIPGYEGGYDNPEVTTEKILLDTNWDGQDKISWYTGRHEKYYVDEHGGSVKPVNCVVIGRGL